MKNKIAETFKRLPVTISQRILSILNKTIVSVVSVRPPTPMTTSYRVPLRLHFRREIQIFAAFTRTQEYNNYYVKVL